MSLRCNTLLVNGAPVAEPGQFIVSITESFNPGQALVTTAAAHGLIESDSIVISGSTISAYNTTGTVGTVFSTTSFDLIDVIYTVDAGAAGIWTEA